MSTQLKLRRGTTAQHSTFTGAEGEITVDTTKDTVVVHDGSTAGGIPLAKESGSVLSPTSVTLSSGTANGVAYLNGSKVLTTGSALTFDGTILQNTNQIKVQTAAGTAPKFWIGQAATGAWSVGSPASADALVFVDEQFGAERMRLTSTGLGIGTSSPITKGHIAGSGTVSEGAAGAGNAALTLTATDATGNNGNVYLQAVKPGTGWNNLNFGAANYVWRALGSYNVMELNFSGNLGLGVTPSAWSFGGVLQSGRGSFFGDNGGNALLHNAYYDGGYKYIASGVAASQYQQAAGVHYWHTAPSGTAGNAISFTQAMTLDASGNLLVNTGKIQAAGSPSDPTDTTVSFYNGSGIGPVISGYQFAVRTGATPTERMRIDSSGNLGIGLTAPNEKLGVYGGIRSHYQANDANQAGALFDYSGGNARLFSYTSTGSNMLFFTNGNGGTVTERMRIDSSGNLLVGQTAKTFDEKLGITYTSASQQGIYLSDTYSTAGSNTSIGFRRNGSVVGSITTSLSATAYNTSSDYRLKENIQPMQNALDVVAQLNPVTYTWKADGSDGQGFIAHELQAVVPDCVTGEKDAVDEDGKPVYQGVDTSFLVATLTKAIQEQQELINQLTARVAQLEGN